ncbi:hypothetical protein BDD12DRAFT_813746 [Trichophaea hybrida]|nr:hypothetical protein BDD12DRAFT_813746 [Trichophaea hybrida]
MHGHHTPIMLEPNTEIIAANPIRDNLAFIRDYVFTNSSVTGVLNIQELFPEFTLFLLYMSRMPASHLLKSPHDPTKSIQMELTGVDKPRIEERLIQGTIFYKTVETLIKKVFEKAPDLEVWQALYQFIVELHANPDLSGLSEQDDRISSTLFGLQEQWKVGYRGISVLALKEKLARYDRIFSDSHNNYYAKIMPILQSSGTGKSRLINELGNDVLSMSFTLRENGETGFPPGDLEVTKYLKDGIAETKARQHLRVVSFLSATISNIINRMDIHGNDQTFVRFWQKSIAPDDESISRIRLSITEPASETLSRARSSYKKSFCNDVVNTAKRLSAQLIHLDDWEQFLRNRDFVAFSKLSFIEENLDKPLCSLLDRLPPNDTPGLKSFFVIDEASHLVRGDNISLLVTFRRVLSFLKKLPVWSFLLSTESSIGILHPANEFDGSSRVQTCSMLRVQPFYGLPLDLEASEKFSNAKSKGDEIAKPLKNYNSRSHMTMLGRPLWAIYRRLDAEGIRSTALMKLLGGKNSFNPQNRDHVFAVLASRVSLNPSMKTPESSSLAQVQVMVHLRLIDRIDVDTGRTTTCTPSEPLVAEAAASALENNWLETLKTFNNQLLLPGLLDAGLIGELYTRIILIMARDSFIPPVEGFRYSELFSVGKFLRALIAPALLPTAPTAEQLLSAFECASGNFTHFTPTRHKLDIKDKDAIRELLHGLLYSHAALELAKGQSRWDLLIPVYFGSPDDNFDTRKISAITIQVKNQKERKAGWEIDLENFKILQNYGNPILAIQLELGVKTAALEVQIVENIYGLRIFGRGVKCFGFLERKIASVLEHTFSLSPPLTIGLEKQIVDFNERFRKHTWSQRFPVNIIAPHLAVQDTQLVTLDPSIGGSLRKRTSKECNFGSPPRKKEA